MATKTTVFNERRKKGEGENAMTKLSERELNLLVSVVKSSEGPFSIDFDKVAKLQAYKTPDSARTAWITLRKKLGLQGPQAAYTAYAAAEGYKTGRGPAPPKRKTTDADQEAGEMEESPTKKKRGPTRRFTGPDPFTSATDENDGEEDEDAGDAASGEAEETVLSPKKKTPAAAGKGKAAVAKPPSKAPTTNKALAAKGEQTDDEEGGDEIPVAVKTDETPEGQPKRKGRAPAKANSKPSAVIHSDTKDAVDSTMAVEKKEKPASAKKTPAKATIKTELAENEDDDLSDNIVVAMPKQTKVEEEDTDAPAPKQKKKSGPKPKKAKAATSAATASAAKSEEVEDLFN